MKKFFALFTVFALASSFLAGCAGGASSSSSQSTGNAGSESSVVVTQGEEKEFTVGLIQFVEHPSLDEIRQAITQQLEAEGAAQGMKVTVDYKNAQADTTMINSISRQFVDDKVDLIIAIATPAAQGAATAAADAGIPVVFSAVTDPVAAGLVENMKKPEGSITGTSDAIDIKQIFELANELTPGITSYGLIYNKGEANSVSVIEETKKYLDSVGISYEEKTVTSAAEVKQASRVLLENNDAIFAPIDNTVASAMAALADEAIAVKKPVYVAADSMVRDGGLATVGVNYTLLGQKTADMALRILGGDPVANNPVEVLTEVSVVVNQETATAIGVDVSNHI